MSESITVHAVMHPSAVLIECPACHQPMTCLDRIAQCDNEYCDKQGRAFDVELPKFDVILREREDIWRNGYPRSA